MTLDKEKCAREYDIAYSQRHFFNHQDVIERPFLEILIRKARLRQGASILDAGCGQGFFTCLFAELGFKATGVDLSTQGILTARKEYGSSGASFEVGDIATLPYVEAFDCVFARGLSLYNSDDFASNRAVTDGLLRYLKPGGVFIFMWYTILDPKIKSPSLIYHSIQNINQHFARYPNAKTYFSMRFRTFWLRTFALSTPMTYLESVMSRLTGKGGYAVTLLKKSNH